MRILLSNDDGVHAPGIRALHEELGRNFDSTIIAPLEERSTTGHSLSLDKPLRLERFEEKIYGCSGFPGDCVLMGLGHVLKGNRPQVVVSGINRGANLGQDLYYSGTIAAAREAAFHNVPSMAVSLAFNSVTEVHSYETAAVVTRWCLEEKIFAHLPRLTLLNVNVPNVKVAQLKGFKLTEVGFRRYSEEIHARLDARNREYFWIAGIYEGFDSNPHSDCEAVQNGFVSVTPQALVDGCKRNDEDLRRAIEKLNAKYFA
jgi:5'-nucleotidase